MEVRKVADKLAEFVAKNGRGFEEVTKQRNPGNTPFRFLFDKSGSDYQYYEYKVKEFRSIYGETGNPTDDVVKDHFANRAPSSSQPSKNRFKEDFTQQQTNHALATGDSLSAMNAFMQLAAQKEKKSRPSDAETEDRPVSKVVLNETGFDRRKVVDVIKPDGARGHHMQDFIPPEEMARFLAKCGDSEAAAAAAAIEQKTAIGADNIGHKLLQKMGWKEGEGIGASGGGMTVPIKATGIKQDNLGVGATAVGEVDSADDIYEQYRKRMMLGYKFRPNPLGNPRKAYY